MTNRTFKSGESREQGCLLPARVEDYVEPDNPVRAIDSFVGGARSGQARLPACEAWRGRQARTCQRRENDEVVSSVGSLTCKSALSFRTSEPSGVH
jgi:hypothetical protein